MTVKSCEKLEKSQVALTIEVGAAEFEADVWRRGVFRGGHQYCLP